MKGIIVDDHQLFVAGIKHVLKPLAENVEIFESTNAEQCIEELSNDDDMDFMLLDLQLPGLDGLALLEIIKNRWPEIPVLIVTGTQNTQIAQRVIDKGASGYLCKTSAPSEFVKAIECVVRGEIYVSSEHAAFVRASGVDPNPDIITRFTSRQLEVLNLMAQGHPNKIIASKLGLTEHTVKVHISNIFHTIGVHNRTACVKEAVQLGIVHLPVGS